MLYEKGYHYIPVYEYASVNQHGERYKKTDSKCLRICRIIATDQSEHKQLIIMGSTLDVPVRFDFVSQRPYLELSSSEKLKKLI